jgi:hypothetical protein
LRLRPVHLTLADFRVFRQRSLKLSAFRLRPKQLVLRGQFPKIAVKVTLNVFQQLSPSETQHSRILRDLLDPHNPANEYGAVFLKLFFELVLDDPEFIPDANDRWEVTAEQERFDVRIRNQDNSKIIILENKSNGAGDQPNQLYRYWYWGIHREQKGLSKKYAKILYISPADYKQPSLQTLSRFERPGWLSAEEFDALPLAVDKALIKTVFFKPDITNWLEACLNTVKEVADKEATDMSFYLKHYYDYWRNIMSDEVIKQADEYFEPDIELWDSFVELNKRKDTIIKTWYSALRDELNRCFSRPENVLDKWEYTSWDDTWSPHFRWYLAEYGRESLCLWLWRNELYLWASPNSVDLPKVSSLLQTETYVPIVKAFGNRYEPHIHEPNSEKKIIVRGDFSFGDPDDGHLSAEKFAWYARYETEKAARQILETINRFREITTLFEEINREVRK